MDKVYLNRIIECVGDMCKNGKIQDTTLFEREYGLPHLSIENLSNEPEASIRKIIDALSEKDNASKIYIQTGNRSKIIDNNPIQVGDRNLFGDNNKTKESMQEEDCCVKLEKALVEIRYLKKALEERDMELSKKDVLISELISKIK